MATVNDVDREWEAHTKEPESMSVGTLNRVVRDLREALYQEKLKSQTSVREALDRQELAYSELVLAADKALGALEAYAPNIQVCSQLRDAIDNLSGRLAKSEA